MNIFIKIGIIAFLYICFSVTLKSYRPEYVFLMRIFTVILIFGLLIEDVTEFILNAFSVFSILNIKSEHINLLLKVTGIAIITDFICDTLTDSGEKSLASVVAASSKFLIIYLALPVLNGLIIFCLKFVE
ncbi:MAG: hypothetical protein IKW45_03275 [Clostridia bacterium]|nr:hypothetical protein [Clostridia bacterium]